MGLHVSALATHMSLNFAKWSITVAKSAFAESLSLVNFALDQSQIWTVLTAARELCVLVAGVSGKRAGLTLRNGLFLAASACPSYVIEAELL